MFFDRFHFVDPGPLIDRDLELTPPDPSLIDEVLTSCWHPLTQTLAPDDAAVSREQLLHFLASAPGGQEPENAVSGRVPQYHFWMRLRDEWRLNPGAPPLRIVGGIGFRVSHSTNIERYYGNLGYHVFPAARGRNYAERACRLLLPLARRHGFRSLWITCNPNNIASRRTCERLGARMVDIVPVPPHIPLYARGETEKCRYRLELKKRLFDFRLPRPRELVGSR